MEMQYVIWLGRLPNYSEINSYTSGATALLTSAWLLELTQQRRNLIRLSTLKQKQNILGNKLLGRAQYLACTWASADWWRTPSIKDSANAVDVMNKAIILTGILVSPLKGAENNSVGTFEHFALSHSCCGLSVCHLPNTYYSLGCQKGPLLLL